MFYVAAFMNESKMDDLPYFLKLDDGYAQYELQVIVLLLKILQTRKVI